MKKILLIVASVMFTMGAIMHDVVDVEKPRKKSVHKEINIPWIEFKNGLKRDM